MKKIKTILPEHFLSLLEYHPGNIMSLYRPTQYIYEIPLTTLGFISFIHSTTLNPNMAFVGYVESGSNNIHSSKLHSMWLSRFQVWRRTCFHKLSRRWK
ncbi:hypothetical protein Lal_00040584 [Lupinus albus]|nr:hypothetical protein Lal_00040584 [Lupinus albus]